jgi:hypothetical protein
MHRRDISMALFASGAGSALLSSRADAQTCTAPCFARTAAEIAAGVATPNQSYQPGDVRRYGAMGNWNGSTGNDDTAAIQNALNCNAAIFLPAGRFKTSATLIVPPAVQIFGSGGDVCSIEPQSCDGLSFAVSSGIGPTVLSDFAVRGNSGSYTGIKCPGVSSATPSPTSSTQVNGIRLENVRIHFFNTALYLRTFWHSTIRGCVFNNVYNGIKVLGQSTVITIEDCQLICNLTQGSGGAVGVTIDSSSYTEGTLRPESITIQNNLIFGFDRGLDAVSILDVRVLNNVLDYCGLVGAQFTICDGTCSVENNWIALNSPNVVTGINFVAIGAAAGSTRNIRGNFVVATAALAGSNGIAINSQQNHCIVDGNSCNGFTQADIYVNGAANTTVSNNLCASPSATYSIYNAVSYPGHTIIEGNSAAAAIFVHPTANGGTFKIGKNGGRYSTYLEGSLTIAAGATSGTVSFASLPGAPPNFSSNVQYIEPRLIIHAPGVNLGTLWGTATDSAVTINCGTAPASNTEVTFQCVGVPVFSAP